MTTYSDLHEIQALLRSFRDFDQCVVADVLWGRFGTQLTIRMVYIWEADGSVRKDAKPAIMVDLICDIVEEVTVRNELNSTMMQHIDRLNWGFGEVALIVVAPVDRPHASGAGVTFHRLTLRREVQGPWVEVVFAILSVRKFLQPGYWPIQTG